MTYPNRINDGSAPKTLRDYRREEEQRDSDTYNRSLAAKQGAETRKRNAAKKAAKAALEALSAADAAAITQEVLMGQVAKSRAIGLEEARERPDRVEFFNIAPQVMRTIYLLTEQMKQTRTDINYVAAQAKKR